MPLTYEQREKLLDDHVAMIEAEGGIGPIMDAMKEFQELSNQFLDMELSLLEQYPDKWVAMGKGGVIAVGNSEIEAVENLEKRGIDRTDAIIKFMDTNPPSMIL